MELLGFGPTGWGDELRDGLFVTLMLAVPSYLLASLLAIGLAALASSERRAFQRVWRVYSSIMTGVPSLLIVFLIFYNLPLLLSAVIGRAVEVSQLTAGIVALTLVYGAYLGEILRGAILSIPAGQFDAGKALGLHTFGIFRLIIFPQVWRLVLPGYSNIWLVVLKDTVLVSLVGLTDIVRVANVAAGNTGKPLLFYFAVGVVFVVLALLSEAGVRALETRLERPYARVAQKPKTGGAA